MSICGSIIFGLGLLLWIAGEFRLLVIAYRRNLAWFFGCLFLPLVGWVFLLLNAKQAWKPFVMAIIGFLLTGIGYWVGGLQFLE
jgi:hypothetical protein